MLEITIPATTLYNEDTLEFIDVPETTLKLEHSLLSISQWESKYKKPFLNKNDQKSENEMKDYIKMMTITQKVNPLVYECLSLSNVEAIQKYIEDPMTATVFSDKFKTGGGNMGRLITNELVYCWMTQLSIPFSCEKWHISRLLTLINVCSLENQPPKKMSQNDVLRRNASLNKARRKR